MADGINYTGDLLRYVLDRLFDSLTDKSYWKCWRFEQCRSASNNYSREQFEMSTDSRSIKIAFAMSVIAKVGEFLNTLTMQYELRYKWWINAVVMILSVPHCLCWSFYFQNIITFLFEQLSCAVEILIWSDAVDFLIMLLGMPYSVVTAQQACSTEMVNMADLAQKVWTRPIFQHFSSKFLSFNMADLADTENAMHTTDVIS